MCILHYISDVNASESSPEAGRFEASALAQVKLFNHSQKFHILPATASNLLSSVIHLKLMKEPSGPKKLS